MKSNKHHHYTISFEKKQRGRESIFQFLLSIIWRENFVFDLHTARCPQKIAVSVVEQQSDRAGAAGARVEGENLRMLEYSRRPPFQVIRTRWISLDDLLLVAVQ